MKLGGRIILTDLHERTLYTLNPITGEQQEIVANLPFDYTLLYGSPQIVIDDRLILDLISTENTKRFAVNMDTHEYKELELSAAVDGIFSPYLIYGCNNKMVLVRVSTHMESFLYPMPDGSIISDSRPVDDWAIISANDFLTDINNMQLIDKEIG